MTIVLHVPLALLGLFSTSLALDGYDFVFNRDIQNSNAAPRALLMKTRDIRFSEMPKTAFAICFYVYLENVGSKEIALVSYSSETSGSSNEVYLLVAFESDAPYMALLINGKAAIFNKVPAFGDWTHVCISWNSKSGEAILDLNGKRVNGKDNYVRPSYQIGDKGYLVFGQDQDDFEGEYDPKQGVTGRMTQIKLFARQLTEAEVNEVMNNGLKGEVIDWSNSTFLFMDGMRVEKTTAPIYLECGEVKKSPCKNIENTEMSPYDLENPFDNGLPRAVTGTLKNVDVPDMKEFSICCYLYNTYYDYEFQPLTYKTNEGKSVITIEAGPDPETIYFGVGNAVGKVPDVQFMNVSWMSCETWNSSTGELKVYINGEEKSILPNISKSYIVPGKGKFVITQHQAAPLNKTNPTQGFYSKLSHFYMWTRQLTKEEVASFYECTGSVKDYLVDPSTSEWDVKDQGCPPPSESSAVESVTKSDFRPDRAIGSFMGTISHFYFGTTTFGLYKFTACFRIYSESDRPNIGTFIDSFNMELKAKNGLQFRLNNSTTTFPNFAFDSGTWHHVCVTWSGMHGGSTQLFVDGEKIASVADIAPDEVLTQAYMWKMYNYQYAPADEKDPKKGFYWKTNELNVWDYVISEEKVKQAFQCSLVLGNYVTTKYYDWNGVSIPCALNQSETTSQKQSLHELCDFNSIYG